MEILDNTSTLQGYKECVTTTGKASYVLCSKFNLNKQGFGALFNIKQCVHCPHGKSETHQKGGQVSLKTCVKCSQFLKIDDDKVHCRYAKLQGYITNPPKRNRNISPLTYREKVYIDIPD